MFHDDIHECHRSLFHLCGNHLNLGEDEVVEELQDKRYDNTENRTKYLLYFNVFSFKSVMGLVSGKWAGLHGYRLRHFGIEVEIGLA